VCGLGNHFWWAPEQTAAPSTARHCGYQALNLSLLLLQHLHALLAALLLLLPLPMLLLLLLLHVAHASCCQRTRKLTPVAAHETVDDW
jgi:hypothetical protein